MTISSNIVLEKEVDHYPSRGEQKAGMIPRQDPVVYAMDKGTAPVAEHLVEQFEQQGFMILEDLFSAQEVVLFQQALAELRTDDTIKSSEEAIKEPGSGEVRSVFRIHEINPVFKQLAADHRLVALARYLLNDQVYIHQSRLNYKPGYRGKEFYWHSDFETWHVEDGMPAMRALSMSITLTENDANNGALMLIPGSHLQYVVCEGETPREHYKSSLRKQEYGVPGDDCLRQLADQGGIVSAASRPGSVIVFDCNIMHGSNSNITPYPRSNAFFVYNALSNRVVSPFCNQDPRPEYICSRKDIRALQTQLDGNIDG